MMYIEDWIIKERCVRRRAVTNEIQVVPASVLPPGREGLRVIVRAVFVVE